MKFLNFIKKIIGIKPKDDCINGIPVATRLPERPKPDVLKNSTEKTKKKVGKKDGKKMRIKKGNVRAKSKKKN